MFSVYSMAGKLFRGSLEQLRQVGGVSAVARNNAIQAVGRDGRDAQSAFPSAFAGPAQPAPSDEAHRTALAAYAQTQKVVLER